MWSDKKVKALRSSLEITQEEMAKRIGVSIQTVQSWEQGRKRPSPLARRALENFESTAV